VLQSIGGPSRKHPHIRAKKSERQIQKFRLSHTAVGNGLARLHDAATAHGAELQPVGAPASEPRPVWLKVE
jgi:hypothetical protein